MKKPFLLLLFLLFTTNFFSQNQILNEDDIPKLNSIIKSLEETYIKSEIPRFTSLPQTTASYFEIVTENPNDFLSSLKKSENLQQLRNKYTGLQVDKDILVIKNIFFNYKNEKQLKIKSFEIGSILDHGITLAFNDSLDQENIKHFHTSYTNKKKTTIRGFYLNEGFKITTIPEKYARWMHYTDIIVKPDSSIFYNTSERNTVYVVHQKNIIDSLVNYYETKTGKPPYVKEQDLFTRRKELDLWQSKKQKYSDSLYRVDSKFRKLLFEALTYAEENKVSNGDLEDFTAQLISEERALDLMRQNRQVGTCSFDNGPVIQQKRIAKLAAQTYNWEVFIQSFLNVMNDNVSRIVNSNIASNAKQTYINELTKLDLDVNKVLLGSNLRIEDSGNKHYFSDGSKVAKAYANLDAEHQQYMENVISDIIRDESMDAFNKLHFYNTYKHYKFFLKDSIQKIKVEKKITDLVTYLPIEIKSRIENPHKQLYDLLYQEKNELDRFEIKNSLVAHIGSFSYDGQCWQAELIEKGSNGKIIYDLTMPIGVEITPLKNFLDKKVELKSRIEKHSFLQRILTENPENKIYIKFTKDKSFANHKNKVTREMPEELASTLDFNDAISLYIAHSNRKHARYVLLKNDNLLILGIPTGYELPGYDFEDLMTEEKKSFISVSYKSYKLFNEKGEMIN